MKINKTITSFLIQRNRNKYTGFTLTELLVAMLLGILVLIAASSLFFSGYRTHRTTDAVSRIQEQQRLAFELMARDIRNAGSFPCRGINDLVWLTGDAASSDIPGIRYYLANGLIGNYYEESSINKHKNEFDSLIVMFDPSINHRAGKKQQYPVIEHRRPDSSIKALNIDKDNLPINYSAGLIICNAETAILFGTKGISGNTIQIAPSGMNHENLCGGGFTRTPNIAPMSVDCEKSEPVGPTYCFWGDMSVIPTENDKAACDEIGQSQAYIFYLYDFFNPIRWMWYVDNIDAQGKGDLFNGEHGKVAEGVTRLQLRYRLKGTHNYVDAQTLVDSSMPFDFKKRKGGLEGIEPPPGTYSAGWSQVDSVHLRMTFQTLGNVGTDDKPLERTMETYIAIRSRLPEIYNEYAH